MKLWLDAKLIARFWSMVDRSGGLHACWPWLGSMTGKPGAKYGRFSIGSRTDGTRKSERASRVALCLYLRRELRADALHSCNNPPCCNPRHLREGGRRENALDCVRAGRHGRKGALPGERHPRAKLTRNAAREIVARYAKGGVSQANLASMFGISQRQVSRIVRGERWQKGLV